MKKNVFLGLLTIMLVFSLIGCSENNGTNGDDNNTPTPLTGTVTITGTAKVGETLTANISGLTAGTGNVSYQWKRAAENNQTSIGTNSGTYQVVEADIDHTITVIVTRTGNTGSVTSDATDTVIPADPPELTGTITISGKAMAGQTLTVNTWGLDYGTGALTYQWKRVDNDEEIDIGEDSDKYQIVEADINHTIIVTVTREGYTGSVTSNPTDVIVRPFWTIVSDRTSNIGSFNKITYNSNRFVAVGFSSDYSGKIMYSDDKGVTWTNVGNTTFTSQINDVYAYSDTLVAVGSQGRIAYSDDNGETWNAVTTSTFSGAINTIIHNSKWVAGGADGRMAYSYDGVTWTAITATESTFGAETINSIATGLLASYWIAAGTSGKMARSSDGMSWLSIANSTFGNTSINSVAYGGSGRFVAVGNAGKIAYSSDYGITWTAVTDSPFGTTAIRHVSFNDGSIFGGDIIAVGNDGKTAYSTDHGVTWTLVTDGSFGTDDIHGLAWDNSGKRGVAVGWFSKIAYTQYKD